MLKKRQGVLATCEVEDEVEGGVAELRGVEESGDGDSAPPPRSA